MNNFYQKRLLVLTIAATCMFLSCENETPPPEEGAAGTYYTATARVNYNQPETAQRAVFIDFSSANVVRELPLRFFDLAIYTKDGQIHAFADSGAYGAGVTILKTPGTDISADLTSYTSGWVPSATGTAGVGQYTFKTGYKLYNFEQTELNPLDGIIPQTEGQSGAQYGKVVIVKTETNNYYKVIFNYFGAAAAGEPGYKITVVKGINGTLPLVIEGSLAGIDGTDGFGMLWFELDGDAGPRALNTATALNTGAPNIPKAAEWDLLCTRTDELQSTNGTTLEPLMPIAQRSSILSNEYKGVRVWIAAGKSIDKVFTKDDLPEIEAIGYTWYGYVGMPPTYYMNTNTYIVKTVEGNYAKIQPGTFNGPNNEHFHMKFRYLYGDSSGKFAN